MNAHDTLDTFLTSTIVRNQLFLDNALVHLSARPWPFTVARITQKTFDKSRQLTRDWARDSSIVGLSSDPSRLGAERRPLAVRDTFLNWFVSAA